MKYAEYESLRNYLNKNLNLRLSDKILDLDNVTKGLEQIHEKEQIHRDLHIGNIVKISSLITDMGLCKPANYNTLKNMKNSVYGVLPYIASKILPSDVYSFGIITVCMK